MRRICALGASVIALALGGSIEAAQAAAMSPSAGPEGQARQAQSTQQDIDAGPARFDVGADGDREADQRSLQQGSRDETENRRDAGEGGTDDQGSSPWIADESSERGGGPEGGPEACDGQVEEQAHREEGTGRGCPEGGRDDAYEDRADGLPSGPAPDRGPEEPSDGEASAPAVAATDEQAATSPAPHAVAVEVVPAGPGERIKIPSARQPASSVGESTRRSQPRRRPRKRPRPDRRPPERASEGAARGPASPTSPSRRHRPDVVPRRSVPSDSDAARPRPQPVLDGLPGAGVTTGVPSPLIERFQIPIFLLPIYQAAGIEYGVRWEVLAAINEVETNYGRNLNVSSAGALGWMQFMPQSWETFGVDGNKDGVKDPYNPVDAIFAAANYLERAGAKDDLKKAIFAYNHADWYVDMVLVRARMIAGIPQDLVGSLTGLTEGRFPVAAHARYRGDISKRDAGRRFERGRNAARVIEGDERRQGIEIYARRGAPVVAVNDGIVKRIGRSRELGRYLVLQDVYGNRFTYAGLGQVARLHPAPRGAGQRARTVRARSAARPARQRASAPQPRVDVKRRLFAHPERTRPRAEPSARDADAYTTFRDRFARPLALDERDFDLRRLGRGSRVIGGTVLGRVGRPRPERSPHLRMEIRPAGRGAPRVDPKPILDGWRLLESTAVYRASGRSSLRPGDEQDSFSIGQVLLLPKPLLERRVLSDKRIELYGCGRRDVISGQVDRRVLATLAYLAEARLHPTVSSLKCGHSFYTRSGNVSHHSSGSAVDIAALNGVPILGHQGAGGITDRAVRRLMLLQGTLGPDQIISLLDLGGSTFAMGDHHDHIHVGFRPLYGANGELGRQASALLEPGQWHRLLRRLGSIENPRVSRRASRYALAARRRAR